MELPSMSGLNSDRTVPVSGGGGIPSLPSSVWSQTGRPITSVPTAAQNPIVPAVKPVAAPTSISVMLRDLGNKVTGGTATAPAGGQPFDKASQEMIIARGQAQAWSTEISDAVAVNNPAPWDIPGQVDKALGGLGDLGNTLMRGVVIVCAMVVIAFGLYFMYKNNF